ncbi:MAG: cobalamin biosynthesis protein [Nitrospirae bacterium]|nr:cobalamin biosynthesis protein [Nitrospirota bacterium]
MKGFQKKLWFGLLIMALLSPLGIVIPRLFNSDGAWGEWGTDKLGRLLGYVPEGLRKYADFWKAPVSDYSIGGEGAPLSARIFSYIGSGILGIFLVGLAVYLISRLLGKHGK